MRFGISSLLVLSVAVSTTACGHQPSEPYKTMPAPPPSNFAAAGPASSWSGQTRVPGEYLVTLVAGTDVNVIAEAYGSLGIKSLKKLGNDLFQINLSNDPGPEKMEALRSQDKRIKAVQPNLIYRIDRSVGGAQ